MNYKNWIYPGSYSIRIDFTLFLLRLIAGWLMLLHGHEKLTQILNGNMDFADPLGIGEEMSLYLTVFAEFVCSILLILGLFTRFATIPLIATMVVIIGIVFSQEPLESKELAILYALIFYVIYLCGPGRLSLDFKLFNSKSLTTI